MAGVQKFGRGHGDEAQSDMFRLLLVNLNTYRSQALRRRFLVLCGMCVCAIANRYIVGQRFSGLCFFLLFCERVTVCRQHIINPVSGTLAFVKSWCRVWYPVAQNMFQRAQQGGCFHTLL